MQSAALKDSLTALDDMLHDFFVEHAGNEDLTENLRELVETAQRNITTAKNIRSRQAMNDALAQYPVDISEVSSKLSVQERWMLRHIGLRSSCDASLLGVNASHMVELGLIRIDEASASLTELGTILNDHWKTRRV